MSIKGLGGNRDSAGVGLGGNRESTCVKLGGNRDSTQSGVSLGGNR